MLSLERRRLTATLWVVLSLLVSQLALASYVCPPAQTPGAVMEMAMGQPCESLAMGAQLDEAQPGLCLQHCAAAPMSFEPAQPPVASLPAILQVLLVPSPADPASSGPSRVAQAGRTRPPPDPLFLSTLRLRV